MYGMRKTKLSLLSHDVSWATDFDNAKERILGALNCSNIFIEHIGSTAIPGVYAKPILDIAILSGEIELLPISKALEGLGYEFRGQYGEQVHHYYAVLDRDGVRYCQLHLYAESCEDFLCKIQFRDVLRVNTALAKEYSEYKQSLAKLVSNKGKYAEIKSGWLDTFINKVMVGAPNA